MSIDIQPTSATLDQVCVNFILLLNTKQGEEIEVKANATVKCTTKIEINVIIGVCAGKTWKQAEKHAIIPVALESKLTSKLGLLSKLNNTKFFSYRLR